MLSDKSRPILLTRLAKRGTDEGKIKIGDEISFNRTFYEPEPLHPLVEIRADIEALEQKTDELLEQTLTHVNRLYAQQSLMWQARPSILMAAMNMEPLYRHIKGSI